MNERKVSMKFKLAWAMKPGSMAVLAVLLNSYVSFFATNFMMIPVATVGIVFMISKVFDGFTDIVAGYFIERTRTKWGKARPYEIGLLGYWGCTVALFCAPKMGETASVLYLFMMYTFIQSIFYTMVSCNDAVYLSNTGVDSEQAVSISSFAGIVTMLFSLVASVIVPQMAANMGTTRGGWRMIAVILAIPMAALGMIRFICIKEKTDTYEKKENLTLKEGIGLLTHNKYILLFALYMLISNIGLNLNTNVNSYYASYIYGDLGVSSFSAVSLISMIIAIAATPVLGRKIGFQKTIRIMVLTGAVGYVIKIFNVHSLGLYILSSLLHSLCFTVLFMFVNVYMLECMDYGEWKNGKRGEGMISCAYGVMCKIGTAIGMGISGILMGVSGFDANMAVQTESANYMIIFLCTCAPAICGIILYFVLHLYKLDKMMPEIRSDLEKSRKNAE